MAHKLVECRLESEVESQLATKKIKAPKGDYIPVRTDQKTEKITIDDKFGNGYLEIRKEFAKGVIYSFLTEILK